jgi:RNA polymerase sigma-70 factor (ECF subfamily)
VEQEPLKEIFKREFSKVVAVISKIFGLQHIEIAEDIVSETFLAAAENWGLRGVPENPTAWIYAVAKQKALYHFRRNKILEQRVLPEITARQEASDNMELDFSDENIRDSQLKMMFAVCNPAIASEAQIGLALRVLCGFGIDEIAEAFLTNKETINKRLFRAKEKLRAEKIAMEMPPDTALADRLDNVLRVIYLLFNEGYYSRTQNRVLQKDVCYDAMRLALVLSEYERTNLPKTNALLALMCFHASRFDARQPANGAYFLYDEQDESLWDQQLIKEGVRFLVASAEGNEISSYHLEARIAYWHCTKEDTMSKWREILSLYDQLLMINFSPAVALNRIFALSKVKGINAALAEAEKLGIEDSHFYFLLLGELYTGVDALRARASFERSLALAKTPMEKEVIQSRIDNLKK